MHETKLHLGEPPEVANAGDGTAHTVRPGRVSLVPPGATVRFRYRIPDLGRLTPWPARRDACFLTA